MVRILVPKNKLYVNVFHRFNARWRRNALFVIISVIGQELLAQGRYSNAVEVLESALKIGTCSLKLRGSVFSALSSAYWALNSLDKVRLNMRYFIILLKYYCIISTIGNNVILEITGNRLHATRFSGRQIPK